MQESKLKEQTTNDILINDIVNKWIILEPKTSEISFDTLTELAKQAISEDMLDNNSWAIKKIQAILSSPEQQQKEEKQEALPPIQIAAPANINSQTDLDSTLKNHRAWIAATLNPKISSYQGRANLSSCDLRELKLKGADLRCADLRSANLKGLDLSGANFSYAHLEKANFQDTVLHQVNFRSAKVELTDLRGAQIIGCQFEKVDKNGLVIDAISLDKI